MPKHCQPLISRSLFDFPRLISGKNIEPEPIAKTKSHEKPITGQAQREEKVRKQFRRRKKKEKSLITKINVNIPLLPQMQFNSVYVCRNRKKSTRLAREYKNHATATYWLWENEKAFESFIEKCFKLPSSRLSRRPIQFRDLWNINSVKNERLLVFLVCSWVTCDELLISGILGQSASILCKTNCAWMALVRREADRSMSVSALPIGSEVKLQAHDTCPTPEERFLLSETSQGNLWN